MHSPLLLCLFYFHVCSALIVMHRTSAATLGQVAAMSGSEAFLSSHFSHPDHIPS